jgi:hypothetical protein
MQAKCFASILHFIHSHLNSVWHSQRGSHRTIHCLANCLVRQCSKPGHSNHNYPRRGHCVRLFYAAFEPCTVRYAHYKKNDHTRLKCFPTTIALNNASGTTSSKAMNMWISTRISLHACCFISSPNPKYAPLEVIASSNMKRFLEKFQLKAILKTHN